jgi:hypothetical protein
MINILIFSLSHYITASFPTTSYLHIPTFPLPKDFLHRPLFLLQFFVLLPFLLSSLLITLLLSFYPPPLCGPCARLHGSIEGEWDGRGRRVWAKFQVHVCLWKAAKKRRVLLRVLDNRRSLLLLFTTICMFLQYLRYV